MTWFCYVQLEDKKGKELNHQVQKKKLVRRICLLMIVVSVGKTHRKYSFVSHTKTYSRI